MNFSKTSCLSFFRIIGEVKIDKFGFYSFWEFGPTLFSFEIYDINLIKI